MNKSHHGHLIQGIWLIIGLTNQMFFIKGIEGLLITIGGIVLTFLYSIYVTNKLFAKSQNQEQEKKR